MKEPNAIIKPDATETPSAPIEQSPREKILQVKEDWKKNKDDVVKKYLLDTVEKVGRTYAEAVKNRILEIHKETGELPSRDLLEKAKALFTTMSNTEEPLSEEDNQSNIEKVLKKFLSSTDNKEDEKKSLTTERNYIKTKSAELEGSDSLQDLEHLRIRVIDFLDKIESLTAKDAYWIPDEMLLLEKLDKDLEERIHNTKSDLALAA